jgi:hypothetical protein
MTFRFIRQVEEAIRRQHAHHNFNGDQLPSLYLSILRVAYVSRNSAIPKHKHTEPNTSDGIYTLSIISIMPEIARIIERYLKMVMPSLEIDIIHLHLIFN